jgi:predicted RNA-binding protein with PIN domain
MPARLLIDGYNLLHASEVFVPPGEPATLERTRLALLNFLAAQLPARQRRGTTIVFDAAQAPPGLPHQLSFALMRVLFSRRPQQADDLLEELLLAAKGARELLVVSSDHRVQRAARQRGAHFCDSEQWLRELRQTSRVVPAPDNDLKPGDANWEDSPELAAWLAIFQSDSRPRSQPEVDRAADMSPQGENPASKSGSSASERNPLPAWNPFPPGYGEDLLADE